MGMVSPGSPGMYEEQYFKTLGKLADGRSDTCPGTTRSKKLTKTARGGVPKAEPEGQLCSTAPTWLHLRGDPDRRRRVQAREHTDPKTLADAIRQTNITDTCRSAGRSSSTPRARSKAKHLGCDAEPERQAADVGCRRQRPNAKPELPCALRQALIASSRARPLPASISSSTSSSPGLLTGLVYGLMALGLSVIFGVVRVVNFAHGEMMTHRDVRRDGAVRARSGSILRRRCCRWPPRSSSSATCCRRALINPFITRPEHSQFMLLVAVAIIMVNGLLMVFGPDARNVQIDYQLDSFEIGKILIDRPPVYAAGAALVAAARAVRVFQLHADRKGDPRLRRQLPRRAGRRPEREAPVRAHLRPGRGLRRGRRLR